MLTDSIQQLSQEFVFGGALLRLEGPKSEAESREGFLRRAASPLPTS